MNKDQLRESILGTAAWNKVGLEMLNEATKTETKVEKEEEPIEEEAEGHTCPLCSTVLEEEVSDEALLEHAEAMLDVFQETGHIISEEEAESSEETEEEDIFEDFSDEDLDALIKLAKASKSS